MHIFHVHVIVLIILVPLSSCFPLTLQKPNHLLERICKHTPNYQVCIPILLSCAQTSNADIEGLGLCTIEALKEKATEAMEIINKLKKTDPELIKPLTVCSLLYHAVLTADIPVAIEALTKGVPKFAEDAMSDSGLEAEVCEQSFELSNSPLTNINEAVYCLSPLAKIIIHMLL